MLCMDNVRLEFPEQKSRALVERRETGQLTAWFEQEDGRGHTQTLSCAYRRILELAIPCAALPLRLGRPLLVRLSVEHPPDSEPVEQHPPHGTLQLRLPPENFEASAWSA